MCKVVTKLYILISSNKAPLAIKLCTQNSSRESISSSRGQDKNGQVPVHVIGA